MERLCSRLGAFVPRLEDITNNQVLTQSRCTPVAVNVFNINEIMIPL